MAAGEAAEAPAPSLSDLPEQCLMHIMRLLDGAQLAALLLQDRRLRQIAGEQTLWERVALERWPRASAAHYGGDWRALYRHRACLAPAFVSCVDRCHSLTAASAGRPLRLNSSSLPALPSPGASPAASPVKSNVYGASARPYASIPGMLFDQVMQMLFSLCLWTSRLTGPPQTAALGAELGLVRSDMAWWLAAKPEAVLGFVRRSCELLGDWDMWENNFTNWQEVLWRRSALQFLADLQLGPELEVCPSVTSRLHRELGRLDEVIRSVDAEGSYLATRQPEGLPRQHWWYRLRGQLSGPVC